MRSRDNSLTDSHHCYFSPRDALAGASDQAEYGAAAENSYSAPVPPPVTEAAYDYYEDEAAAPVYGAYDDNSLSGYEEETTVPAIDSYLSPEVEARRGRNRGRNISKYF